jgi:hypothetical protein
MSIKSVGGTKATGSKPLLRRRCFNPIIKHDSGLVFVEVDRWYCLDTNRHISATDRKGFVYNQEFKICGTKDLVDKTIKATQGPILNKLKGKTTDQKFSFSGKFVEAQVIRVIDADTIVLSFYVGDFNYCWSCRLSGIDSREKNTELGSSIADKVKAMFADIQKVYAILGEFDNHSRLMATVYLDKERKRNVSTILYEENKDCICEYWGDNKKDAWKFHEANL